MKFVLVAADRMEFRGFRKAALQTVVRIGAHDFLLVANGVGVKCAAAAAEAGVETFRPDGLISTGFCGALVPELQVADVVVATEVAGGESRYAAAPIESARPNHQGLIRTHSRVAGTAEERRTLHATGAIAVEMEASGVAGCARKHSLPFYCVKVVTDLAGETMANDFNRALREDGHFDTIILLQGTLRHPFARIPELLRLQRRCVRAARSLGEFFADCRF